PDGLRPDHVGPAAHQTTPGPAAASPVLGGSPVADQPYANPVADDRGFTHQPRGGFGGQGQVTKPPSPPLPPSMGPPAKIGRQLQVFLVACVVLLLAFGVFVFQSRRNNAIVADPSHPGYQPGLTGPTTTFDSSATAPTTPAPPLPPALMTRP